MNIASIEVALIALIPSLLLCTYIYEKDRVEKEPVILLLILFVAGVVAYIPALFAEQFMVGAVDKMFASSIEYNLAGVAKYTSNGAKLSHFAMCAFVGVALVEETIKWIVVFLITNRSKQFNCLFDGVVYSTFVSLGFATFENVRYALIDGWDTLLIRAITSVPGHLCFGIFMGICYTTWRAYSETRKQEKIWIEQGKIEKSKFKMNGLWLVLSYILPILVHGIYSYTSSFNTNTMNMLFYAFLVVLYVFCFVSVNFLSDKDASMEQIAKKRLEKAHPQLRENEA